SGSICCSGTCCPLGQQCLSGQCRPGVTAGCPTGQLNCQGVCIDPLTNVNNCGGCGVIRLASDEVIRAALRRQRGGSPGASIGCSRAPSPIDFASSRAESASLRLLT